MHWQKNGATATILVDLIYTYDTSSNRTMVDNQVATTGWDYAYAYDALNRLMQSNRGDLTGGAIDYPPIFVPVARTDSRKNRHEGLRPGRIMFE